MQAVILAGGESSRFWPLNTRHKSLLSLRGQTLIGHTLDRLAAAGVTDAVVVEGPERDVEAELDAPEGMDVSFAVQEEPKGMGNALKQARNHITGRFLVTGPYRVDAGDLLETMQSAAGEGGAVVGAETDAPDQYGMLALDGDTATGVVEKPGAAEAPSQYRVVSTYLLEESFFTYLDEVYEHEYSFEDALDAYMDDTTVGFAELEEEPPSLKYPWDALDMAEHLLEQQEPSIADTADVADSATIDGNVVIGERATVYENAVIRGPCYIGDDCTVGNNALVRAHTNVEAGSRIGANAEVRGSVIQEDFSMHSGFVGDSVIGRNVSLGAGTVVANRRVRGSGNEERPEISVHVRAKDTTIETGRTRLGVMLGDGVEVGTQANLMPGICIGQETFIGPSAMVRTNVGEEKRYFTKMAGKELDR